jgi:hypothetical protein
MPASDIENQPLISLNNCFAQFCNPASVQAIPKSVELRAVPEAVLESLDVLTPTQLAPLHSTQIKLLSRLVTGNQRWATTLTSRSNAQHRSNT